MPFYFDWYVEKRVILGCPVGDLFPSDYDDVEARVVAMIEEGIAPVHLIYDMRHIGQVNVPFLRVIQSGQGYLTHPKFGWGITYGQKQNRLLSFMAATAAQWFQVRNRVFDTAEEAQTFLMGMDESLDLADLPAPIFNLPT